MQQRPSAADLCQYRRTHRRRGGHLHAARRLSVYRPCRRHDAAPDAQPALGTKGELVFAYDEIDQQQVTNTLRISVTRDLAAPGRVSTRATVVRQAWLCRHLRRLEGQCRAGQRQADGPAPGPCPAFAQTPVSQTVAAGAAYTWTLTAPNTGSGPAHNFVVTQTLPAGLEFITATVGSSGSTAATPTVATVDGSTVITWDVAQPAGRGRRGRAAGCRAAACGTHGLQHHGRSARGL